MKKPSLHQFNNGLSVVVIALCLYVILAPLWPQVTYKIQKTPPLVASEERGSKSEVIPKENTLVIPSMKLQQTIHEGGEWMLSKGIWHQSNTGSPDSGNMVLSGHRFTYGGPAVLYHADKVKKSDKVIIYWQQRKYEYTVRNIMEIPPTKTDILNQNDERLVTIYTCTPLLTAKNRLVIQAEPIGANE